MADLVQGDDLNDRADREGGLVVANPTLIVLEPPAIAHPMLVALAKDIRPI